MDQLIPANIDTALLGLIVFAILGLVQFIKSFGLQGHALTLVSFLIGAVYYAAISFLPIEWIRLVVGVPLFGLAASGVYDFGTLLGSGIAKAFNKQ